MGNRIWNYALVLALAGWAVSASSVRAQVSCDDDRFDRATLAFERGQLIQTIRALQPCVDQLDTLEEDRKVEVLRLLAFVYYDRDEPDSSRQMVRLLVRKVDRGYRAQIGDPQFFRDLIRKNKRKFYEKRWVQLGATAVAGGVVVYWLTRTKTQPLPQPCPPPNCQ